MPEDNTTEESTNQPERENRVKLIRMSARLMVDIFNWHRNPPTHFLSLPESDEIPAGAEVMSVHTNWDRRCIEALVYHPSFGVAPDGDMPPLANGFVRELTLVPFPLAVE